MLDKARVTALRDRFLQILAAVVADPDYPLAGQPLATIGNLTTVTDY